MCSTDGQCRDAGTQYLLAEKGRKTKTESPRKSRVAKPFR